METAGPHERIRAYVEVALTGQFDRADFAIFSDALYRDALTETWVRRFEPWLALPDDLSEPARARLTAARLLADGYWTAAATVDHSAWLALVAIGYIGAFIALTLVLRAGLGIGVAYGIWGGGGSAR